MPKHTTHPDPADQAPAPQEHDISDADILEGLGAADLAEIELRPELKKLIETLTQERDDAREARMRAQADFVNFQRRSTENEIRAQKSGTTGVVRSLLPVLDHIDLALGQDHEQVTVDQMVSGARMIRDELLKALDVHEVETIRPEPGTEFNPNLHQAVMRAQSSELEPDSVVDVLQVGYQIDGFVLRPASVSVATPGDGEE